VIFSIHEELINFALQHDINDHF